MQRVLPLLGIIALLSACEAGGNPFPEPGPPPGDDGGGDQDGDRPGGIGDGQLPPGTEAPTPGGDITRFEALNDQGGGFVTDVAYDAASDTFQVDNLAFDGANIYVRDDDVGSLSSPGAPARYAVYEATNIERDEDGDVIHQLDYRAIYGVSSALGDDGEPLTQFAIVRTGSYVGYGFGGFIYERNDGVDLPETGQATYAGEYAGLRVFDGRGGMEYTRGDVDIAIDFEDFNDGSGVKGEITNRAAFDLQGNPIPLGGEGELILPDLTFVIGPGVMTEDGEISAGLQSFIVDEGGALQVFEEGTYYAIVAGENAEEIVGIFVVESDDPRFEGVTAQETGGFIVYR
jgi:hypothetical protein